MADEQTQQKQEDPRFSLDELREGSRRRFGVSPHVLAAALSTNARRQTFTEAEAQKLVDKIKGHAPEPDNVEVADG